MTHLVRACSHSVFCCTGTAAGIALASLLWPSCSHIGYWTPILLNVNLKSKLFFFFFSRDLLWKANRRLLSLSLWMGTQKMVLDYSDTVGYPGIFIPALGGDGNISVPVVSSTLYLWAPLSSIPTTFLFFHEMAVMPPSITGATTCRIFSCIWKVKNNFYQWPPKQQ